MKSKKYWILAAVVTCVSVFLSMSVLGISFGEKNQLEIYGISTLKGLKGVNVHVFLFDDESTQVNRDTLQTKVELELRKAGIKVVSDMPDNNVGFLFVVCQLDKAKDLPMYYGALSVSLHQDIKLIRNPKIMTRAQTWPLSKAPTIFIAGDKVLEQQVDEILTDLLDIFLNDYLAANPKEPEKRKPTFEELVKPKTNK